MSDGSLVPLGDLMEGEFFITSLTKRLGRVLQVTRQDVVVEFHVERIGMSLMEQRALHSGVMVERARVA